MLTATYRNTYRNKQGNQMLVYSVSGSKKELDQYRLVQGENLREDEAGVPLYFAAKYNSFNGTLNLNLGSRLSLEITSGETPKVVINTEVLDAQHLTKTRDYLAQEDARHIIAARTGAKTAAKVVTPPIPEVTPQTENQETPNEEVKNLQTAGEGEGNQEL